MGNYCWMCERMRPNEAFSGRNHHRHLCRKCARLPKSERDRKARLSALWDMLFRQSRISEKNIRMATAWAEDRDEEVTRIALLVADIGRARPGKRKRLSYIRRNNPEIWRRMIIAGIVEDWSEETYPEDWDEPQLLIEMEQVISPFSLDEEGDDLPF